MKNRLFILFLVVGILVSALCACENSSREAQNRDDTDVEYKNEWTYIHKRVGPLTSPIWCAFIDTREVDLWHIYLSPVKDVTLEEVVEFAPVRISLPVDFPLDDTVVRFSDDTYIAIEYLQEVWNSHNAPQGVVRAEYDARNNDFRIYFKVPNRLTGSYEGSIEIVE